MNNFESLKARHVTLERDTEPVYENIDEFIMGGSGERPWQVFELTQNQDVTEWIKNPDAIELLPPILADLAERLSQREEPFRILDVGCYGGYVFDYLKSRASSWKAPFEYTGVDIQERAIRDAQQAHAGEPRASFQRGDLFELSHQFSSASFDVVVCYRVLHHLPRFRDCLRELAAVSKGWVHTALPIKERSHCVRMRETNLDTGTITYSFHRYFSREEIVETAEALSLQAEIHSYPKQPYSTVLFSKKGRP
ncbi:MAG: class I SAM-dependent methyltransferase [Kiritimatiellae bacterium]|nr:class I SAM-dependent methyltransferase [Kiritimatiellia bacterium]